jgi:hypothetical protein
MGWIPAPITIDSIKVSARDRKGDVTLTLGGGGLEEDPAGYGVYLVKPHASGMAVLRAFVADPKSPQSDVLKGENIASPGGNTLQCTLANPPAGEYVLAVTLINQDDELGAFLYPDAVKVHT